MMVGKRGGEGGMRMELGGDEGRYLVHPDIKIALVQNGLSESPELPSQNNPIIDNCLKNLMPHTCCSIARRMALLSPRKACSSCETPSVPPSVSLHSVCYSPRDKTISSCSPVFNLSTALSRTGNAHVSFLTYNSGLECWRECSVS